MNQMDIDEAVIRNQQQPVLGKAAQFLASFRDEVDAHSDGWPYWQAPIKAAEKLMQLLQARNPNTTMAEFKKALTPIKSFYTRRGYQAGMAMPAV
jgi:hypothetical protein